MSKLQHADSGICHHMQNHPAAIAVSDDRGDWSCARVEQAVARVRNGLAAAGLQAGDRVAVVAKNRAEQLILLLASLRGGPVCVPVNRRIARDEMLWIIQDADCRAIFADAETAASLDAGLADQIPANLRFALDGTPADWTDFSQWLSAQSDVAPRRPEDVSRPYLQIYTSGTSGRPKGVVLTEFNALGHLLAVLVSVDTTPGPGEAMYQALPLFHVGGVFASLWALSRGTRLILREEFNPVTTDALLASGGVHHAAMVPAMIQACAQLPKPAQGYPDLRAVLYGASPISRSVLAAATARYGCDFVQIYGMTETHSVISTLTAADHRRIAEDADSPLIRSAGRAVAGTVLTITDALGEPLPAGEVGEVRVSSQHVMQEYWNNPAASSEALCDGQLCTGDAGYLDEAGYLYIVDRLKDIIVTGGENVSSLEVESVLLQHPDISDVAVIGTPDEQWGEAVTALVVTREGTVDAGAVRAFCKDRLGGFKIPKRVEAVASIPRNAAGKILKARLRQEFWQGEERCVS